MLFWKFFWKIFAKKKHKKNRHTSHRKFAIAVGESAITYQELGNDETSDRYWLYQPVAKSYHIASVSQFPFGYRTIPDNLDRILLSIYHL